MAIGGSCSSYISMLSGANRTQYTKKVECFSGKGSVRIKDWIDKIELWPQVEFGTIYSYLIDTDRTYTKEKLQAYKSLKAYNYYSRLLPCLLHTFSLLVFRSG